MNQPGRVFESSTGARNVAPQKSITSATITVQNIVLRRIVWSRKRPRVACVAKEAIRRLRCLGGRLSLGEIIAPNKFAARKRERNQSPVPVMASLCETQ